MLLVYDSGNDDETVFPEPRKFGPVTPRSIASQVLRGRRTTASLSRFTDSSGEQEVAGDQRRERHPNGVFQRRRQP